MDPINLLFGVASNLTGGLVNDMTTVMIALLTLSFILMGSDILLDLLQDRVDHYHKTGRFFVPRPGQLEMERSRKPRRSFYDPGMHTEHSVIPGPDGPLSMENDELNRKR